MTKHCIREDEPRSCLYTFAYCYAAVLTEHRFIAEKLTRQVMDEMATRQEDSILSSLWQRATVAMSNWGLEEDHPRYSTGRNELYIFDQIARKAASFVLKEGFNPVATITRSGYPPAGAVSMGHMSSPSYDYCRENTALIDIILPLQAKKIEPGTCSVERKKLEQTIHWLEEFSSDARRLHILRQYLKETTTLDDQEMLPLLAGAISHNLADTRSLVHSFEARWVDETDNPDFMVILRTLRHYLRSDLTGDLSLKTGSRSNPA